MDEKWMHLVLFKSGDSRKQPKETKERGHAPGVTRMHIAVLMDLHASVTSVGVA